MAPDTSASRYRSASGSQVLNTALGETTELWDTMSQSDTVNVLLEMARFLSNLDNSPLLSGLDTQVGHSTPAPLLALSTLASLL
jgi:hypothetical protein